MLGRVANIQRFCIHDGPGIRTVVFLQGCPLRCSYCHNPEMQDEMAGSLMTTEEVIQTVERDLPFFKTSSGGVTLSGGEPLMQSSFSEAVLKLAKEHGLHTCVETSGAGTLQDIESVAAHTDLLLWDIKFADPSVQAPIDKLRIAERAGARIRLRSVLMPETNAETLKSRLLSIARQLTTCDAVELLPYNDLFKAKLKENN